MDTTNYSRDLRNVELADTREFSILVSKLLYGPAVPNKEPRTEEELDFFIAMTRRHAVG